MTDRLGTLLRQLRNRAGLTQEQLAERSGVSVRTIRRLETGKSTDHRLGTVNLLADALEVGPEDRGRLAATLAGAQDEAVSGVPEPAPVLPEPMAGPLERVDGPLPLPAPLPLPEPLSLPVPAPLPARGALAEAAQELAREVRRRWRREEEQRRVHDPFPLPVRWQQTPAGLTDHWENIQRLGPGAVPRQVDLSGDLRSVAEVYRRISSGRLVILGRAGSGKSILTIRFVLDFLEAQAVPDRVPVIFSLGSWDPTTTALRDWLIDRLLRDHPHLARRSPSRSTLAAALVDADLVLPVLDGFDEIAEGLRREALEALNATSLPLVLTSRRGEYAEAVQAAHAPLVWAAGIELTDLTLDNLITYLPRTARTVTHGDGDGTGPGAGAVWDVVLDELRTGATRASANLAGVLTTPLMVILARTMYSEAPDRDPAELLDTARFPTAKSLEEHLLAGFVPAVYRRRVPEQVGGGHQRRQRSRDPERAQHWLGYLAHHLVRLDHEQQDLAWWQISNSLRRSTRVMAVVLATTLCITLSDWLLCPLVTPTGIGEVVLQGSLMGPCAGLAFGSVYAAMTAFGGGVVFEPARVRLRLPGTHTSIGRRPIRTFTARFGSGLLGGFVMGVGSACALTLERALYQGSPITNPYVIEGTLINMLCFGLIFGSAAGLVFGLMAALEAPVDVTSAATPVSLLSSNRATVGRQILVLVPLFTLAIALGGRLIVDLLQGLLGPLNWKLSDGLFIGAVGGLGGAFSYALAFTAWGQWVLLSRVWLPLTGKLPWDAVAFLDDAYQRGVLRQTGAVYQFRHIRLQHHLGHTFRQRQANYLPASFPSAQTRSS
ncbi:helix-turn-helix transcriptional regulator [Kitasatospora sp. MAP5-34]|uniref:helix-turn-helix domain-containing protein n=1 Tax=Kitasatospora sp. MAP5-34 TaxID=3035102 RepID=UPI002474797E|nr:helix-turn-helix transcriptional regulator [Kitasatospora sp. MAP5-34]MDH6579163.1 transcriptional regulator with XRE-family HTH domain [Kitasatospora sp. MAP5-34]